MQGMRSLMEQSSADAAAAAVAARRERQDPAPHRKRQTPHRSRDDESMLPASTWACFEHDGVLHRQLDAVSREAGTAAEVHLKVGFL